MQNLQRTIIHITNNNPATAFKLLLANEQQLTTQQVTQLLNYIINITDQKEEQQ